MFNEEYNYLDFHGYEAMIANKPITEKLVTAYQNIFGDPQLWNEHYTREEVLENLRDELAGKSGIRLCMNDHELLGFCWAQCLTYNEIGTAIRTVQYYQSLGSPKLDQTLQSIIGAEPVIYLHDLGICRQHRGQIPLNKLISPVLDSLAKRSQTHRVFFWSIEGTRVFKLAERAGFQLAQL